MWAHEEAGQPERKALERGEIRHTLSGAIADQELMLEQERLSCDPAHAARAEEFREGNEQMDRQEEQIAHELKLSRRPICTRLHHSGDSRQNLPIRHPLVKRLRSRERFSAIRIPGPLPSMRTCRTTRPSGPPIE